MFGLENATVKWCAVVDVEKQTENAVLSPTALRDIPSSTSSDDVVEAAARSDVETGASDSGSMVTGSETDHKVELRAITVHQRDSCLLSPCLNRSCGT